MVTDCEIRMKARKGLKWFAICLVLVAFGYWIISFGGAVARRWRNEDEIPLCVKHMRLLELALSDYAQAHGDRLPSADSWCDKILPYVRNHDRSTFVCPSASNQVCSYALNRAVAGMRLSDLSSNNQNLVVLFESDKGWNATGGPELLPLIPRHQPFPENVVPLPTASAVSFGDIKMGYRIMDKSGRPTRQYRSDYVVWSPQLRQPRKTK
jgi:hypothetical protein